MNKKFIKELAMVISKIDDVKLASNFLMDVLTPAELEEISKRLQIVKMLDAGVSQRDVSKKLGVSLGTVSRGSRELKYGSGAFRKILDLIKNV